MVAFTAPTAFDIQLTALDMLSRNLHPLVFWALTSVSNSDGGGHSAFTSWWGVSGSIMVDMVWNNLAITSEVSA